MEGKKLDRTVWNLSTFHAYVSYHVKVNLPFIFTKYQNLVSLFLCVYPSVKTEFFLSQFSEGFMHTRMRRRVESMIQVKYQTRFVFKGFPYIQLENVLFSCFLIVNKIVLSQALDQAKPLEKTRSMNNKSFKRLVSCENS